MPFSWRSAFPTCSAGCLPRAPSTSAFIPLFSKRLHTDPQAARAFAGQALSGLAVLLVAFTLLGEIAMPWLMLVLAPGFVGDPEKFASAVLFARIALPYLVFMSVVALYSGILNAYGRFAIAAFTPTLLNVVLIAVLLVFIAAGGSDQNAAGTASPGASRPLVVAGRCGRHRRRKDRMRLRGGGRTLPSDAPPRGARRPGRHRGGIAQLTVVVSTIIATLQDRVVSWLYYADRLFQLPLGVIGVAIGVVLLPTLSQAPLRRSRRRA